MNLAGALVVAGLVAPIASLITAFTMIRVNRNSAVKLLSEAQQIAQTTALTSTQGALSAVQARCDKCEQRLSVLEAKTEELITAHEAYLDDPSPANLVKSRAAIWAARHAV